MDKKLKRKAWEDLGGYALNFPVLLQSLESQGRLKPAFLKELNTSSMRFLNSVSLWLRSALGKCVVMGHGDAHRENLLFSKEHDNLFAIDWESAKMMPAAMDLATPFLTTRPRRHVPYLHRLCMVDAYFNTRREAAKSGGEAMPKGVEDVPMMTWCDDFLFDIEVGLAGRLLSLSLIIAHSDEEHAIELLDMFSRCADLLDDASKEGEEGQAVRDTLVHHGVVWCSQEVAQMGREVEEEMGKLSSKRASMPEISAPEVEKAPRYLRMRSVSICPGDLHHLDVIAALPASPSRVSIAMERNGERDTDGIGKPTSGPNGERDTDGEIGKTTSAPENLDGPESEVELSPKRNKSVDMIRLLKTFDAIQPQTKATAGQRLLALGVGPGGFAGVDTSAHSARRRGSTDRSRPAVGKRAYDSPVAALRKKQSLSEASPMQSNPTSSDDGTRAMPKFQVKTGEQVRKINPRQALFMPIHTQSFTL